MHSRGLGSCTNGFETGLQPCRTGRERLRPFFSESANYPAWPCYPFFGQVRHPFVETNHASERKRWPSEEIFGPCLAHLLRSDWARTRLLCVEKMVRQQTAPATEVEMEIKLMSLITFFGQDSSVASITTGPQKTSLSLIRWTQHWMR